MYIEFENLPSSARVWVYLAGRPLTENDKLQISDYLKLQMHTWAAHGEPLHGGFSFVENMFLIISVDQQAHMPSGCSIDASTRWIKEINDTFGIDFLSRSIVTENQVLLPVFQVKKHIEQGIIKQETRIYDQQVGTKAELSDSFLKPASEVFSRYFLEKA